MHRAWKRRLLLYAMAASIVLAVSVPLAIYILATQQTAHQESSGSNFATYYIKVINAVKPFNPYVVQAVPTTVVLGRDGRAVAVVQGAIPDIGFWRELLNSFGGSLVVVAGGVKVYADEHATTEVEEVIYDLCRQLGIGVPRSTAVVFGSSQCPYCISLKKLLNDSGVSYIFVDLSANTVKESLRTA